MVPRSKNGSAEDLLNEVNIPSKNKTAKVSGGGGVSNGTASDLLDEVGIDKKKSSSQPSPVPGNETSPASTDQNDEPLSPKEKDFLSGTLAGSFFDKNFGAPTKAKVGDQEVDMTDLVKGPLSKEAIITQGKELARKVIQRNINDQDAALIAAKTGQTVEQVKTAVNKPQTYNLNKSRQTLASDFDENFGKMVYNPSAIPNIDPRKFKEQLVAGDQNALQQYYNIRKESITNDLSEINKGLSHQQALKMTDNPDFGVGPTKLMDGTYKEQYNKAKEKELQDKKDELTKQLNGLTSSVDQVHTSTLNKEFDVPEHNQVSDFNITRAEELGMKKLQVLNPVAYTNLQNRLKAGYTLDQQTKFGLAKTGYDMRSQGLAIKFEDAEDKARPVLDNQQEVAGYLTTLTGHINDAKKAMDKNHNKSTVDAYNKSVNDYNEALKTYQDTDNHPAVQAYKSSYNDLKSLVDADPKLSDSYPEVRRQEMTRALHQAFADMSDANSMNQMNPLTHPLTFTGGALAYGAKLIFNEDPDEGDYQKLAQQFNMPVADVKRIAIGNLVQDQGFTPEQLQKGAAAMDMSVDKFSQLSARDERFRNPLESVAIAKAMGIDFKQLATMSSGMENLEGLKENRLRLDGLLSTVAQGAYTTFKGIQQGYNRYFGAGTPQQINIQNELIDKTNAEYTRKPDDDQLFGLGTKIDTRKEIDGKANPYYLREVANEKANEFNINPRSLVQTTGNTIGQMAIYAGSAKVIGMGLSAVSNVISKTALAGDEFAAFKNAHTIADIATRSERAGELIGTVASGYAQSYDQHYKNAMQYTTDENKLHQSASANAFIEGISELILPDVDIVHALNGNKKLFGIFSSILDKEGGVLTKSGLRKYATAVLSTLDIANKEGLEEVIVEPAQAIANKQILDKTIDWDQVYTNAKQAYVNAFLGTIPTAIGAGVHSASRLRKESLFEVGNEPQTYTAGVQDLLSKGKIDDKEAFRRIQTINTMAEIVQSLPKTDPNGNHYTVDQKIELAALEFRIRKNKEIASKSGIEAVQHQADIDTESARASQAQILSQADMTETEKPSVQALRDKIISNQNNNHEQQTGNEGQGDQHVGQPDQAEKQTGDQPQGQVDGGQQGNEQVLTNEGDAGTPGISLTQKRDLLDRARYAIPEIKSDVYRTAFKQGNMEDNLREAAQQLNNTDPTFRDNAEKTYGPAITEIARTLFPNEKPPGAIDQPAADAMDENSILPDKQQQKLQGLRDDDFAKKYFTEDQYKTWNTAKLEDPQLAKKMITDKKVDIAKPAASSPAPQVTKTEAPPKSKVADVAYVPVKDVHTDVERFQPRGTDFSPESVEKIVNNYDDNKLDPVVLYNDNGKQYVLAGHSRLEAHKQLSEMSNTDPRKVAAIKNGFQQGEIKSRQFKGTEEQAIEFADRSNDLGTKNKVYESANSLRKMREGGASKSASLQRAQTDFGKDGRFIHMLSFLNPKGKLMDTIKGFDKNDDVATKNSFEKMGQWIGSVREKMGDAITNAHENEMMDFLLDNNKSKKFTKESEFTHFINSITGRLDYDSEQPLNLARLKNESPALVVHNNEVDQLTAEIKERQKEYDNINDRLNNTANADYISPDEEGYDEIVKVADTKKTKLGEELVTMRRQLAELKLDKSKALNAGLGQMGLFEAGNLSKEETAKLNEELQDDNITVDNIKTYEENISNPTEVSQQGDGEPNKTEPVQESVSKSDDGTQPGQEQDTSGAKFADQPDYIAPSEADTGTGVEKKEEPADPAVDEKLEAKKAALVAAKEAFMQELKNSRGNLSMNALDPRLIEKGTKLIAAYIDVGVYKFGEIVKDVAQSFGEVAQDLLDAMKGVYGAYLAQDDNPELDDIKTVRAFTLDDLKEPVVAPEENKNSDYVVTRTKEAVPTAVVNGAESLLSAVNLDMKDKDKLKNLTFLDHEDGKYLIGAESKTFGHNFNVIDESGQVPEGLPTTWRILRQAIHDMFPPDAIQHDEISDVDEAVNPDMTEAEHIQIMLDESEEPEDKKYWENEMTMLNTQPFEYWKGIYNAFAHEDNSERAQEAFGHMKDYIDKNPMFSFDTPNDGEIYRVTAIDYNDGVELTGEKGKINLPLEKFVDDMQPVANTLEFNKPVIAIGKKNHPIVQGLLDSVKGMTKEDAEREINDVVLQQLSGDSNKRLRQEIYSSLTDKKQTIANSGVTNIDSEIKKLYNATYSANDLEPNSSRGAITNGLGKEDVRLAGESDRPGDDGARDEIVTTGPIIKDSPGLLPFNATSKREQSDSGLSEYERNDGSLAGVPGRGEPGGSSSFDEGGIQPELEGAGDAKEFIGDGSERTFEDKLIDQKNAEGVPVIPLDRENIAATLPLLKPGQLEDVWKAENRFINHADNEDLMYGKGMLFTNGTGTGKTLLGAGILKRFEKAGKDQATIIVPTDKKAKDWIEEGSWLGLNITQLENTKDAPKGIVITTYANMAQNPSLQERFNHLVIYDESHKINQNKAGDYTANQSGHHKLSVSPYEARDRAKAEIGYKKRMEIELAKDNPNREKMKLIDAELDKKTKEIFDATKVIFLSATPFAYHPSLTYGDGYLYSINQKLKPDNEQGAYNKFFIQNFGYRIRYSKLTKPESGVDVDLLERQFTEGLKNKGVISSRKLDIPVDYSRQFKLVDNELGTMIDEGMDAARDHDRYKELPNVVNKRFNFIYTNQLMEALKARWAVDQVAKHLELGRKVVISHAYIENYPAHPFDFNDTSLWSSAFDLKVLRKEIQDFEERYPQYRNLDMKGLKSPIETLKQAFGNKIVLFNGQVSKTERNNNIKLFQSDTSGKDIIMIQMEAGKEGISLHDKTGKFPRAQVNLGLPYKPTDSIQIEGRVYRTGQKSNATIEYPTLNTNFERMAYSMKINERVRTAENLAMGEEARNMELAFKEGYINATNEAPNLEQGTGGKAEDSRMDKTTEFDKAKTYYYKRGKRTTAEKRSVDGDYYGTPEPLGYKVVQWLDWQPNEKELEPSAGHGAISRFMSKATNNIFIEPNTTLRSEVALNSLGDSRGGTFEDLNVINKFDGIAMNPPFGHGGKTAMDHLAKAAMHLRDGGRINAIVPMGQMNERFDKWYESDAAKDFYVRAKILLPSVVFERAGTNVSTQMIMLDKIEDKEKVKTLGSPQTIDLRGYDNIKDFFAAIEDMELPNRVDAGKHVDAANDETEKTQSGPEQNNFEVPEGDNTENVLTVVKNFHTKNGVDIYVAKVNIKLSETDFASLRSEAKKYNGYYSSFKGNGAIPGFVFDKEDDANKFAALANGKGMQETKGMSMADRIRTMKLGLGRGGNLFGMVLPIPQIWNGAVELVAKAVEGGVALVDALRKGYDYIRMNYDKPWQTDKYNEYMLNEMKSQGKLDYNLSAAQKREADKILSRLKRGSDIIKEVNNVTAIFDHAKSKLTDPADILELEDSNKEFQRYLFDSLAISKIEATTNNLDLNLRKQTFWQKTKENVQNRFQRMEQTQKAINDAGITIEEKNDMVNAGDRWRSIAESKIEKVLHEIGAGDADLFGWKGHVKVKGSLFDRMSEKNTGIPDFLKKFDAYLHARHATERNAHNATMRRNNLAEKIAVLDSELNDLEAQNKLQPSSVLAGLITKKKNEIALHNEYRDMYSDPNSNRNYVSILERKIRPDLRLMDDGGSGMTNQQAKEVLEAAEEAGHLPKLQELEKDVREMIIEKILENQLAYGLINQESYDFLNSYYTNYVPLKVSDKYFEDNEVARGSKMPGSKIYKSKGADYIGAEYRVSPLIQSIIDLKATIYDGEQNNYMKTIANAISDAPDEKVWQLRAPEFVPVKDRNGRILKMNEVNKPENGIEYKDHGDKRYLVINDVPLHKAITEKNVKSAIPVLAKINSYFRAINTYYNPNFTLSNLFRDMQDAGFILSSTQKSDVRKNFGGNIKKILSIIRGSFREQSGKDGGYWTDVAKDYSRLGGNMSWFHQDTRDHLIDNIKGAYEKYNKSGLFEHGKNLALGISQLLERMNNSVETATRMSVFDAARKSGIPDYKAVEIARNATINFNKKGNYSSVIDSLYLFANATVQGSTNLLWTILTTKKGLKLAGGIVALGMLQSFLNNAFSDCEHNPEDCYDNIPDYEKDRSMIIKVPWGHGFIKIPMAYGLNVFFNMGEKAAQAMQGKQSWQSAATGTMSSALSAFNPAGNSDTPILQQISPTATDPIVQWYTNRDGLNRPIYNDNSFNHKPDSQDQKGSPTAQNMAHWLNKETGGNEKIKGQVDVSPGTLDWLFQTAFGGMGQFVKQLDNTAFPDHGYSNIDPKDIPIVNRFYTQPHEHANKVEVFDIKDRSYNEILTQHDIETFNKEVDHAVSIHQMSAEKASGYKNTVKKNQFELTNTNIIDKIDATKTKILDDDELNDLKEMLDNLHEDGKISDNWYKGYKAEITENQNKLKKKHTDE